MNSSISFTFENDPLVGTLFDGRYLVNFLVARGGMGSIYQVNDVRMGRIVALKILRPEFNKDPQTVQRFERESATLKSLSHPNICQVFDAGCSSDGVHYFTMEFLEGSALDKILTQRKCLDPLVAVQYMIQVASALSDAHHHGIVHRDLKPANIFIVQIPNTPEFIKVIDFGVAKLEDITENNKLTNAGATLGTPFYMSPEQVRGSDVDARADIYALGVIFWECLFGAPPFVGSNLIEVFQATVKQKLPKLPSTLRTNKTWRHIYAVLSKALRKNRRARYDSMAAFQGDLEKLAAEISGAPISREFSVATSREMAVLNVKKISTWAQDHFGDIQYKPIILTCVAALLIAAAVIVFVILLPVSDDTVKAPQTHVETYKFFTDSPAAIQINGKRIGASPTSLEMDEKPPFSVVLINDNGAESFTVSEHSEHVTGFAVNLKKHRPQTDDDSPRLVVDTTPSHARVSIDGLKETCLTPCDLPLPNDERLTVRLSLDGYRDELITAIPNGADLRIQSKLSR